MAQKKKAVLRKAYVDSSDSEGSDSGPLAPLAAAASASPMPLQRRAAGAGSRVIESPPEEQLLPPPSQAQDSCPFSPAGETPLSPSLQGGGGAGVGTARKSMRKSKGVRERGEVDEDWEVFKGLYMAMRDMSEAEREANGAMDMFKDIPEALRRRLEDYKEHCNE